MPDLAPSPDMWRSYAEPAPVAPPWATPKNLNEAQAAVSAALQFQGMRGFQQDVQAGIDPQQAMLKHGPKMFFKQPAAFAAALHRVTPPPALSQGPVKTFPALDEKGMPLSGVHILPSKTGFHVLRDQPSLVPKLEAEGRRFKLGRLGKQIDETTKALSEESEKSPRYPAMAKKLADLERQADALLSGEKGPSYFREKKTGKKVAYRGNPADVPLDLYEPWTQP